MNSNNYVAFYNYPNTGTGCGVVLGQAASYHRAVVLGLGQPGQPPPTIERQWLTYARQGVAPGIQY